MRILYVNSKLYTEDKSWPQKVFHDLINLVSTRDDIDIYVLCEKWSDEYKKIYSDKIHFLFLEKPTWILSFFVYQFGFYNLIKNFDVNFFDIAHFQNFPWWKFFITFLWLKKRAKFTILTVHDWVLSELKYYSFIWKITHLIHWYLSALLINKFDFFIVFSDFMHEKLEKFLWTSDKISELYIWMDITTATPPINNLQEKYILWFWWLNKKKWYEYLIEAYSAIHNDIDQVLLIWWNWPEEKKLKELVKKYNLENKIRFIWFIDWDTKLQYIANADLIVHPAEYEWYGIAILESLFLWKKVLVWDIWWQVEFINDFSNLYLFKSKSIFSLSKSIFNILKWKYQKDSTINERIMAELIQKYSNTNLGDKYINFYKWIIWYENTHD